MTPQESDLITTLLARLKSAGGQPKDPDADRLIRQAMAEQPDAPCFDLSLRVKSGLITSQLCPSFVDLKSTFAPAYSVF